VIAVRSVAWIIMIVSGGCAPYAPQAGEDTNRDGRVTFYDDDPTVSRDEFKRHMDRQSPDRERAMRASDD
jgi:hypothetical protein